MSIESRVGEGIGARVPRKEDERHLHGKAQFVSDMAMPGLREVAFARSPVAHGRIRAITKPQGCANAVFIREDMPGVRAIRSKIGLPSFKASEQPPLASGKVRFVGEPIAVCVAHSRAAAEDLAESVEVNIEELPAVVSALTGRESVAVRLHEEWDDNLFLTTVADTGIEAAAKSAAVVVTRNYRLSRQVMNPLEGKAILAYWDDRADQLVVYLSTQIPHMMRTVIAEHLEIDQGRIRIIAPDVGGGFGYKCVLHPEELCVAWLAYNFRKPFRWVEDRREHLIGGANCREHDYRITAYTDARGKLLGLDAEITIDAGAYSVWPFTACLEGTMAGGHLPGPYVVGAYRAKTYTVATNKPSIVPYRGVARTGICFAMELTIDAIARTVGREPSDVRRENLVPEAAMPYTNPTGKVYDSGNYARSLDMAVERMNLAAFRARQEAARRNGQLIGVGFANYIEMTAHGTKMFAAAGLPFVPGYEQAFVRFTPDGGLELRVGVQSHGQGMETSLAQIAHEVLGVPVAQIAVTHGDTAMTPYSTGTYASRSITMAGGAVARACRALRERLVTIAAHLLQCSPSEIELKADRLAGPSGDIGVREIATTWYLKPHLLPPEIHPGGMEVTESFKPRVDTGQYSYGTHAAVVAVDREFGRVEILDYVIVEDCGTMVNPMIVEGQTYGGLAQGIGTALLEEVIYNGNGQPLTSTLADYMLPGAAEMPTIDLLHIETPSPNTEFGIKGVGEGGAIPPPAAIFNAVNDALAHLGKEVWETPLSPRRLLAVLRSEAAPTQRSPAA